MSSTFTRESVAAYADAQREQFEKLLKEFVEIPSVSMDPAKRDDCLKMADKAKSTLEAFGFAAKILPTPGLPLIYGEKIVDPAAPTVLIYNHMDVQPGGDPKEWKTDPFVFIRQGDTYYGRGTTDDKGPGITALLGAKFAIDQGAKLNVKFLWELEEEIGSPNFKEGIKSAAEILKTDFVVVSDTIWVSRERPAAPAGLRGLQALRFTLETGTSDQHSGVCGGAARNPISEMASLLGKILDGQTGKVKIPGFYDDVLKPTKKELENFKKCGFSVKKFKQDHAFKSLRTDDALEVMTRVWAMPTFEVHGIVGGYSGPGVKTVIPPRCEAKISMRLVPDMDPKEIVKLVQKFVKKENPDVVVEVESALKPYRGLTEGPLADLISDSVKFGFGKAPVFVREGGSIGTVVTMEKVLEAPVAFLGLSLPEHGYHAPNENYDWGQASGGIAAFARLFENAAAAAAKMQKPAKAAKPAKGSKKSKR
jgi:acetylornithine deacetylase/succinyl-diaminopimelate desuccinylase-like protein